MPFPKEGWWIDRSSYTAGSVAFHCLRGTCEGFQAHAAEWARSSFDFGGFSNLDGEPRMGLTTMQPWRTMITLGSVAPLWTLLRAGIVLRS